MTTPIRPELRLAARQHGLITTHQLEELGLSGNAIRHGVSAGRWFPVHRTVFAVGRPELTREGRWLAAVLACGPGAALSHRPAGLLWEVLERGDERPHVTVATRSGISGPPLVTVHRSGTLRARDVTARKGIPVTSLSRTLRDLAGVLDRRTLDSAVRQAERLHRLDLPGLLAALPQGGGDPRIGRLRSVLDDYVTGDVRPGLESDFLQLCRRQRLPLPATQVWIAGCRADFVWPAERLIVETDDEASHKTLVAWRRDREKDRRLMAAGYEVLRFTWPEITNRPGAVAAEIREHLARRRRDLGTRVG